MLRPERMSKVSVAGSKSVMRDTIEAVHDLNLVHLSDYGGQWEGFDNGDPIEGADDASDKLVTVRSIESILDVDPEDAGPSRIITEGALEDELEDVRVKVNELDDRRNELEDEYRAVEERLDSMRPFADLDIELDLLFGYDTIEVRVGDGDEDDVRSTLEGVAGVDEFELFTGEETVGVFAWADPVALDEALVNADFTSYDVPDAEGSPESYSDELRHEKQKLDSKLDSVENEIEDLEIETAGFLLAAEETLSIDVQKAEAPLQFATTEHAFIAEGWIPTARYDELTSALQQEVGDLVTVEELERADYEDHGAGHGYQDEQEHTGEGDVAATDGGHVRESPPVVQDNPGPVKPFQLLVETINRPKYFEFDPTVILFLTFPVFFGFMIGDVGYGLIYTAIGYLIYSRFDGAAIKSLGGIALWSGGFTVLFGILYGEIFGLHLVTEYFWVGALGGSGPPIHKGLAPVEVDYAYTWLVLSLLVGLVHVTLGYVLGFLEEMNHSFRDAMVEKGSWILLMLGVWLWILSTQAASAKPEFMFRVFDGHPFPLGFAGFPPVVGTIALGLAAIGLVLMVAGEISHIGLMGGIIVGILESLNVLVNVLSYARIAAVLLAKAGMAFAVNLLFFGAYQTAEGEYHFLTGHGPQWVAEHHPEASVLFGGLLHAGIVGILVGLLVLVAGHALVLALGITSAGLQAVRLEYVEFFGKFYDGGGEKYEPFGYDRAYTTED